MDKILPVQEGANTGACGLSFYFIFFDVVSARKPALSRSILREGWSDFVDKLSYKAEWYGRSLIQVDRFYPSSKLCHACGHKYKELRLSEREWVCEYCGRKHDRDVNAALNILDEALRLNRKKQKAKQEK